MITTHQLQLFWFWLQHYCAFCIGSFSKPMVSLVCVITPDRLRLTSCLTAKMILRPSQYPRIIWPTCFPRLFLGNGLVSKCNKKKELTFIITWGTACARTWCGVCELFLSENNFLKMLRVCQRSNSNKLPHLDLYSIQSAILSSFVVCYCDNFCALSLLFLAFYTVLCHWCSKIETIKSCRNWHHCLCSVVYVDCTWQTGNKNSCSLRTWSFSGPQAKCARFNKQVEEKLGTRKFFGAKCNVISLWQLLPFWKNGWHENTSRSL